MFFRLKRSGKRGYVQIVENTRDGAAVRQRVIANLGRGDELAASGVLAWLIASGAKAHRSGAADQCARRGCRGRAVGRRQADRRTPAVWQNLGAAPRRRRPDRLFGRGRAPGFWAGGPPLG